MAGISAGDSQRQLLTLIRDFASERSQGERRVSDLKRRLEDLRSEFDAATAELENAKRAKEEAENGLKGSEVELAIADASVLAQQGRANSLQAETLMVGDGVASLKAGGGIERDEFINLMREFNTKIRKFHEKVAESFHAEKFNGNLLANDGVVKDNKVLLQTEDISNDVENKLAQINAQVVAMEQEHKEALVAHDEASKELSHNKRMVMLAEVVLKETKQLQETAQQIAEMEKNHAYLGEELQKMYVCPSCGLNNMGSLVEEDT